MIDAEVEEGCVGECVWGHLQASEFPHDERPPMMIELFIALGDVYISGPLS